ncbi:plexin-B2-like [Conger conger]|uniref:plexin-B2-like n=1 Tax=Conger conger TaxID=82655 RepID=UPI002A5A3D50|nr:plexin-B2-like [Conger conger]
MARWLAAALFLSCLRPALPAAAPPVEFTAGSAINHALPDPRTGRVYLGAVNAVHQLDAGLRLQHTAVTGPRRDNRQCTPSSPCPDAKDMDNVNKLLLVNPANGTLVVCGSLFRGLCSLLNLSNVEQLLYFNDSNGERTFVASVEEAVSVVGVMSSFDNLTTFLVGKGYGNVDSPKLISTRILQDYKQWVVFENVVDAPTVQGNGYALRFQHDFRLAFAEDLFVYFLFSRRKSNKDNVNVVGDIHNYTFVSRLCKIDLPYHSYIELQLNCGRDNKYNKVQAAYVAAPGEVLARRLSWENGTAEPGDKVLFGVFSSGEDDSAVCAYPLKAINEQMRKIILACYGYGGKIGDKMAVYSPYTGQKPICGSSNPELVNTKKCGAEFLTYPLASESDFALKAEVLYEKKGLLTAVAVAKENEHTVAFLGTSMGEVYRVHLSDKPEEYGPGLGDGARKAVNKNLFFDTSGDHLYITTNRKISRVPVQACEEQTSCAACVELKDPYCGWCVLEGRCSRKQACKGASVQNGWLWSPGGQCVQIQSFTPPSISCKKTQEVVLSVPLLPNVPEPDRLQCRFGDAKSQGLMNGSEISCSLPDPSQIPRTPDKQDYVAVPVKIFVDGSVEVAAGEFKFYNCSAVAMMVENVPCSSCVSSEWRCQWNTQHHTCADSEASPAVANFIPHQQNVSCPRFQEPKPTLIPVGVKTPINFTGVNLELYKGRALTISTALMEHEGEVIVREAGSWFEFEGYKFTSEKAQTVDLLFSVKDRDTGKRIDSKLQVTLYNCSLGREDCSLCKNADAQYNCVWCHKTSSCVFHQLCSEGEAQECPSPKITQVIPSFGPLKGGILVTIKGSNLGIQKEDIRNITVAGVPCAHKLDGYSVSTSVVCEVGPVNTLSPDPGVVQVEVKGGKSGTSTVLFTYRDPKPETVEPAKGPKDGGTVITIFGKDLDTAAKEDLAITVGGVPCSVEFFGRNITCKVGKYTSTKVPSDLLAVTVKYGKSTSTEVPRAFQFRENPTVDDYFPKSSFLCGGRMIVVTGKGFDLIQRASMVVLDSECSSALDQTPCKQEAQNKTNTMLRFLSPKVNSSAKCLRAHLALDNVEAKLEAFHYHPDPFFNTLTKNVITENSIISVTGHGFAKAMTAEEAQAFVGNVKCPVTSLQDDKLFLEPPAAQPSVPSRRPKRDTSSDQLDLTIKFGNGEWVVGKVQYEKKYEVPLAIIIPAVLIPMLLIIGVSVYCYRRKSQQAEREYEKVKNQLANLEESVRDRCKKEFTDLMIEMEDHTSDLSEARIPFLDFKTYTDRVFFLPSKDGANDVMITGKVDVPAARRATVTQALNQFSNLLNSKTFLINFIRTLEGRPEFNAREKVYFASLLTVALHGKLEYYTDIMRTLLLELMEQYVHSKHPKLMLRRSETVVERMLCNWMSICLYQFLKDTAGEPLYKLFKAIKHQVEKGPVDAVLKKAKYTLNDTGLLGDDVEYSTLTLQVLVQGEGPDVSPVKVLNCDTISQVKEKIIEQVYRNLPYTHRPKVDSVTLEWRPGATGQVLSDLDVTSQTEGRWRRMNTLAHYNVRDNATVVLSRVAQRPQSFDQHQDSHEEKNALLDEDKVFHLVRLAEELDEIKSKRGSMKDKSMTKAIHEIYLTRLFSVKGTLQQFVDDFFRSVLCSSTAVPPAVKYFFDFLDEQAQKHDNVDEETVHIWKTNSLPLRFWVNILKNPHFIFDVHVTETVDASLSVIAQTFMDACTKTEHKLSRDSPSNKLLYAKEISTYKKMVDDYYNGIRQMVPVSDQDMNTHLAEVSRAHTEGLNTQVALHRLYEYASKYYDGIIASLEEDPAAQSGQLTMRLQQIAAALENKVTDL